jgi:uncharacterized protein (DUF983 family)
MITEKDKERAQEAAREMALRGRECPQCGSGSYYWLKSSGRCTDCGFHWGIDRLCPDCLQPDLEPVKTEVTGIETHYEECSSCGHRTQPE